MKRPRIGIALGSGSARGWAHIGVLRALSEAGIEPDVVCGTSIGALVGGAYVAGRLDVLDDWARSITLFDIVGLMDVTLTRGGVIAGARLFKGLREPAIGSADRGSPETVRRRRHGLRDRTGAVVAEGRVARCGARLGVATGHLPAGEDRTASGWSTAVW